MTRYQREHQIGNTHVSIVESDEHRAVFNVQQYDKDSATHAFTIILPREAAQKIARDILVVTGAYPKENES